MTRIGDETVNVFHHGRTTGIGTTAVPLTGTAVLAAKGVQLQAADGNSATVYVGNSSVTAGTSAGTDGFPLAAGATLFVPVNDAQKIFLRSTGAGQQVHWFAV